jgi:hypothetical protein
MRTTVDIDDTILRELKRLQKKEKKSLGRLVSDLLASALRQGEAKGQVRREFRWFSQRMEARVDLGDHDAILEVLDRHERAKRDSEK